MQVACTETLVLLRPVTSHTGNDETGHAGHLNSAVHMNAVARPVQFALAECNP
jgi:hypothetical protein